MQIGLISDTHGLLRPEVFEHFTKVDHIIHAGDIGDADLLVELAAIAPVTAVWGNVDGFDLRSRLPERLVFELGGLSIGVIHGQQLGSANPAAVAAIFPGIDLVVFGHSHHPSVSRIGESLVVNPGSAGPRRFALPVTIALASLEQAGCTAEIVELIPSA